MLEVHAKVDISLVNGLCLQVELDADFAVTFQDVDTLDLTQALVAG